MLGCSLELLYNRFSYIDKTSKQSSNEEKVNHFLFMVNVTTSHQSRKGNELIEKQKETFHILLLTLNLIRLLYSLVNLFLKLSINKDFQEKI